MSHSQKIRVILGPFHESSLWVELLLWVLETTKHSVELIPYTAEAVKKDEHSGKSFTVGALEDRTDDDSFYTVMEIFHAMSYRLPKTFLGLLCSVNYKNITSSDTRIRNDTLSSMSATWGKWLTFLTRLLEIRQGISVDEHKAALALYNGDLPTLSLIRTSHCCMDPALNADHVLSSLMNIHDISTPIYYRINRNPNLYGCYTTKSHEGMAMLQVMAGISTPFDISYTEYLWLKVTDKTSHEKILAFIEQCNQRAA